MDGDTDSEVEETQLMGENGSHNFNEQSTGDNSSLPSIRTITMRNAKTIDTPVPKDQLHIIYIITILVSAGILFPWNSYISAIDYFKFLYPTQRVENVIPYAYMSVTLFGIVFTIGSINLLPLHGRIAFGYVIFSLVLLFIPLLDIGIHNCSVNTDVGFGLTVFSVVLVALGSGVQQSSYYGLAGMLPPRYTQAVMVGESVAGFSVSILRIITKASTESERKGAIAFFVISLLYILLCVACQVFLWRSKFVRYYVINCQKKSKDSQNMSHGSSDTEEQDGHTEDGDILIPLQRKKKQNIYNFIPRKTLMEKLKRAVLLRVVVIKTIWKMALSVFIIFFVTLLVFPGLTSQIQNCDISDWPPVILVTVFNLSDFISRMFALLPYRLKPNTLMIISLSRFILVPLLLLCVVPSPTYPIIPSPFWVSIVLVSIVGLSTGYFGTLPMVLAPTLVPQNLRELTGTMMVFFLLSGLTAGAVFATAWTPLTEIATYNPCTNITAEFFCKNTSMLITD